MNMKQHIPNSLTLFNLLSGCIAIVFAFNNQLTAASWLIGIAAVFDFFDGFAARLLKVSSPIGKELDSLADVVSFGVVPGVIMYKLILLSSNVPLFEVLEINIIPFVAFLIPMFSALRLAKFNIDERQTDSFIGLPTPANAILIASFPLILNQESILTGLNISSISNIFGNFYFLIVLTIILSYLLVAELPLMSLKFKKYNWGDNRNRYIFLLISLLLLIFFFYTAMPFIIVIYFLFSISLQP
ncbi:MAG: CDP-diacylglycerol--serine O-phosphatidyltransferase [Bacteroidetes bacterium 4484_249]|nr:MAG: CDP-diacylglycerol--serine O-phosphatidyltransferase [Bacteroidetes bacterium 4484_249]